MNSTDDTNRDEGQGTGMPSSIVLAKAVAAGERRLHTWTIDGTLVNEEQFAILRAIGKETLIEAGMRGDLIFFWIDQQRWYPAVLLEVGLAEIARICSSLGEISPVSKMFFFMHAHGGLNGQTVQSALPVVGIDRVLQLAEAWRQS